MSTGADQELVQRAHHQLGGMIKSFVDAVMALRFIGLAKLAKISRTPNCQTRAISALSCLWQTIVFLPTPNSACSSGAMRRDCDPSHGATINQQP